MLICLTVIGIALAWLLFELDFFRINLMGNPISEYTPSELLTLESYKVSANYVPSEFVPCDIENDNQITAKTVVNIGAKIL